MRDNLTSQHEILLHGKIAVRVERDKEAQQRVRYQTEEIRGGGGGKAERNSDAKA